MAVPDLFAVTETLANLLNFNVRRLYFQRGVASTVTVSTMPPELVGNATDRLNLHLHHSVQDAHYKNFANAPGGTVAQQPMALCLYYILTAHHSINTNFDAQLQQELMGLAMKTFHDVPLIDDELRISPNGIDNPTVMPTRIHGERNKFEISMRPITAEESTNFWSAEQTSTARLSAFYEVRTVFLEPELPVRGRGRVIAVGLGVTPAQTPQVDRTRARLSFTPPTSSGLPTQNFDVSPAQVTLSLAAAPPANAVTIEGSALAGDGTPGAATLVLHSEHWRELDPSVRAAPVDPALNPDWEVTITATTLSFRVQPTLIIDVGTGPIALNVNPGVYSASVEVRKETATAAGTQRFSTVKSKHVGFAVGPHIGAIGPVDAGTGRFTIALAPDVDLTRPDIDLQLRVDGAVYDEVAVFAGDPTDAGSFVPTATEIEFHPLFDGSAPGTHNVALVVNGAESQPFWIEVR